MFLYNKQYFIRNMCGHMSWSHYSDCSVAQKRN